MIECSFPDDRESEMPSYEPIAAAFPSEATVEVGCGYDDELTVDVSSVKPNNQVGSEQSITLDIDPEDEVHEPAYEVPTPAAAGVIAVGQAIESGAEYEEPTPQEALKETETTTALTDQVLAEPAEPNDAPEPESEVGSEITSQTEPPDALNETPAPLQSAKEGEAPSPVEPSIDAPPEIVDTTDNTELSPAIEPPEIVPAQPEDSEAIGVLRAQGWHDQYADLPGVNAEWIDKEMARITSTASNEQRTQYIAASLQPEAENFWRVVRLPGSDTVIGYVEARKLEDGTQQLCSIHVAKEHRAHGIGQILMDAAHLWFDQDKATFLDVAQENDRAQAFYERQSNGYRPTGYTYNYEMLGMMRMQREA
jgi:ribosomal protein S18 acetylase RimI-like enzyme